MEYGRPHCCKFFCGLFYFFCLFLCFGGGDFIYLFMKLCADVGHLYHWYVFIWYVSFLLHLLLDVKPEILKPSHMINGGVYGKYIIYRLWSIWYETYGWSEWHHQEFFRKTPKLLLTISETLAHTWEFSSLFTGNSFSVSNIRLRIEVT